MGVRGYIIIGRYVEGDRGGVRGYIIGRYVVGDRGGEWVYKWTICGGRSRGVRGYIIGRCVEGDRGGGGGI